MFSLLLQFAKKDFFIQKSYRFDNFLRICGIALQLFLFFFISKLIGIKQGAVLSVSGGEYFPFVLIGLAFSPFFSFGLSFCSDWIRQETSYGTIEQVLTFPLKFHAILISIGFGKLLFAFAESSLLLGFGIFFLNIKFSLLKFIFFLIIAGITILLYFSLGMIAGSFILIYKRGDPIQWVLINFSDILGGLYFPVSLLPGWLKAVSFCIPTTHILHAARSVLLADKYKETFIPLSVLLIIGLLLFFAGVFLFKRAFDISKKKGTLGHF